jgi:hypothetical protein
VSRKVAPGVIAVAAATITAVAAAPASADALIDPAPIGANQYFFGDLNGRAGHATIKMGCFVADLGLRALWIDLDQTEATATDHQQGGRRRRDRSACSGGVMAAP